MSGSRVEVCADEFGVEPVEWLHIASPPTSEVATAGGGGGGSSVSVAVEEVEEVEVTRVVTSGNAAGGGSDSAPAEAVPDSAGNRGGGAGGGGDPAEQWHSPYEIGEVVEVTGIVEGIIYLEDGVRSPELSLRSEEVVDGETRFFVYPLLGEPQLLEEIAEANRLHIRVTGEVIPGPDTRSGSHDQALVVRSFERVDLTNPLAPG